ncbi:PREDICTED: uncharacterized protein LOC104611371 [Nelumbo nucifera]|uniref:Uncharacterized protein LOC104611371 n=1 Tax=Nelumbo nucifera TaxID=4432 RepID=A0A1U8BIZ3_NELNU|nr:PREDICTED: uncharacterized protein LOC104611371 [Nelumbo nucifera]
MKLVWSPETASKAYIDTVKSCELFEESSVAELVSAMAGGWNPQLIVEAWHRGGIVATSVGLSVASRHTHGRHVCVVPDERSRSEYVDAMREVGMTSEVIVGEAEEVMDGLVGVDFLVVDCRRKDFARILRLAKLSPRGAVLICKNAGSGASSGFRWRSVLGGGSRVVRSAFLPVGKGVEIAHVGATGGAPKGRSRWIRHVDQESGEEHLFRR